MSAVRVFRGVRKLGADVVSDAKTLIETLSGEDDLAETKRKLLRTQARLHQLQESSVAEAAFVQLRGQYLQVQYEMWLMKACAAWMKGERLRLTHCLEASLDCTTLETQAMVADWLKWLAQFAESMSSILALELEELLLSAEWRALMKRVVAR